MRRTAALVVCMRWNNFNAETEAVQKLLKQKQDGLCLKYTHAQIWDGRCNDSFQVSLRSQQKQTSTEVIYLWNIAGCSWESSKLIGQVGTKLWQCLMQAVHFVMLLQSIWNHSKLWTVDTRVPVLRRNTRRWTQSLDINIHNPCSVALSWIDSEWIEQAGIFALFLKMLLKHRTKL